MKLLDTRDLLDRKTELEALRDAFTEAEEALTNFENSGDDSLESEAHENLRRNLASAEEDFGMVEEEELKDLEEIENSVLVFHHGKTLIPEADFQEYAEQLAEELGLLKSGNEWPYNCIDWEQAANQLSQNYQTVSYQGEDYYVRA